MRRRYAFVLLILLFDPGFKSQGQERLTIEDAIKRTLQHNFDIRVSDITAQQAQVNNTAGNAGLLPNVNGTAGVNAGFTNSHIEFADGRIQEVSNAGTLSYNAAVTATYTVFAAGRAWLIRKQLRANEQLALVQFSEQMQLMVSQTIQAYARTVWQKQQAIAIDTSLALAATRMFLSQVKYETGASAKVDYLQARVDYNSRRADSLQQIASLNAAFADLNLLMGEDPFKTYIVDDSLNVKTNLSPVDRARLHEINLSIEAAKRNAEISRIEADIRRTFLFPTLGTSAGFNWNKSESASGTFLFNRNYGPTAGINLNVPIFQGGNIRRQIKFANLQAMKDELLYERQGTEISRQYRTAWNNYKVSVYSYQLEHESIQYAKENLDIQRARFKVGIATTLETREAENSYVQALIRLYTSAYNLKINETKVLELESNLTK
jgi:outer membrane protein